jgi:hypothetical protein
MAQDVLSFFGGLFSNDGGGVPAAVASPFGPQAPKQEFRLPTGTGLSVEGSPDAGVPASDFLGPPKDFIDGFLHPYKTGFYSREALAPLNEGSMLPGIIPTGADFADWFGRGAIVILGFIFVAVGLAMFGRQPVQAAIEAVKG